MILARFNNLFSVVGSRWANFSRWFHSVTHSVTDTIRSSKTDWIESIYVNRVVDRILCISLRMSASVTKIYDKKSLKHRKKEQIFFTLFQQFLLQNLMNMCTTNEVAWRIVSLVPYVCRIAAILFTIQFLF